MIHVLLVSSDKDFFTDLASNMEKNVNLNISRAESGGDALSMISVNNFELVVTDESLYDMTGLKFVEKTGFNKSDDQLCRSKFSFIQGFSCGKRRAWYSYATPAPTG